MARIITLTFEPAVDMTTTTPRVVTTDKLRCTKPRRDPGGGGINVARVVTELGGEALAVFPAGGPTGQLLIEMIEQRGVQCRAIAMREGTRRNITVNATESGEQFRFVMPAPVLSENEAAALVAAAVDSLEPDSWLVLGGGVPQAHAALLGPLLARAKELGVRVVADTSGAALESIRGVWLTKPNLLELETMAGRDLVGDDAIVTAARTCLIEPGISEMVVVSLAADGALLVTADRHRRFAAPRVVADSAVGAGDSMVAGIVLASQRGMSIDEAVHYGTIVGSAALLTPATELVHRADVERLLRENG